MFLDLCEDLGRRAAEAAKAQFGLEPASTMPSLTPRFALGDLAFAFPLELAKRAGKKPREVAEQLRSSLEGAPFVRKVEIAGPGYLNVFLDRPAFARRLFT